MQIVMGEEELAHIWFKYDSVSYAQMVYSFKPLKIEVWYDKKLVNKLLNLNQMENKQDITVKTAEEIFNNTFDFTEVDFEGCIRSDAASLKEEIISAMEEYAQQFKPSEGKQDGWISVKDRLPESNQKVLCYYPALGGQMRSNSWMAYTDQNEEWFKRLFTHWRPLPPAPSLSSSSLLSEGEKRL